MSATTFPAPSPEEEAFLNRVIEDWSTRTPMQRAICVCIARGLLNPEKVASAVGISPAEVQESLKSVWGVLYDRTQNRYWFK